MSLLLSDRAVVDESPPPRGRYVFASERGGPFTPWGFAKLLTRAGDEAKIGFKVHPHMLCTNCPERPFSIRLFIVAWRELVAEPARDVLWGEFLARRGRPLRS